MTLELVVQTTAVLVVAWVLTRLMVRATAATRHLVWHAALLATLALASLAQVPLVPRVPGVPQVPQVLQVLQVLQVPRVPQVTQREGSTAIRGEEAARESATNQALSSTLGTLGTLGTLVWFAAGWAAAARVRRRSRPAPAPWQVEVNALCARMHIAREVRLGIIADVTSPLATGLWRPVILLPQLSASWNDERRQAVLLHELAHIRRGDCRVQLLVQAACALYWFNPLVWIAAAHLRAERERACDDEVLRLGARASSYAAHLLDIARELRPLRRPMAALAMARPSDLEGRLLAVLATGRARVPARASRWAVATALTFTTLVALGATSAPAAPAITSAGAGGYVARLDVMNEDERRSTQRDRTTAEQTLARSSDPQDRERAVLALAFSSGRDVIPALLGALHDADAQVREKAAIGLALRRDARVVEPLIAAITDPDSQVREKVAIALGTSGDPRAGDVLRDALHDPDRQVREKATAGLVLLGLTRN